MFGKILICCEMILILLPWQVCIGQLSPEGFISVSSIYKPDKCWNGYTLVAYEEVLILIIDMNGKVVHRWDIGTDRATLLENGNVLVMQGSKAHEYNWDGNLVREYVMPPYPGSDRDHASTTRPHRYPYD